MLVESRVEYLMDMESQLEKAVTAVRTQDNTKARRVLAKFIKKNPRNARAWFMLSHLVDERERQIECLRLALNASPNHQLAKKRLAQLESLAKAIAPQRITRIQPFQPIPRTALGEGKTNHETPGLDNSLDSLPANDSVRLLSEEDDELESIPNVVELLFEDVARLPIITSPHQELWLGIQLKAAQRWHSHIDHHSQEPESGSPFLSVYTTVIDNHLQLTELCLEYDIQPPKLEIWVGELLSARQNIYKLKQSRLHRFIRRTQKLSDETVHKHFMEITASIAEVLCWFPDKNLIQTVDFIQKYNHLPPADDIAMWLAMTTKKTLTEQIQKRAKKAEQTLVVGYLRYALRVARGYVGQGVDYADLVQEGFGGLMRAAKKFDYCVQARFGTYATSWIWQAIGRAIADQSRTVRLPVHINESLSKLKIACMNSTKPDFIVSLDAEALFSAGFLTEKDLRAIKRTDEKGTELQDSIVERYRNAARKAHSLLVFDRPMIPLHQPASRIEVISTREVFRNSQRDVRLLDIIPDQHTPSPDNITDKVLVREVTKELLSFLGNRNRNIIELRYGLNDGVDKTLEEVGQMIGLTRERIRQIEAQVIRKLKGRWFDFPERTRFDLLPDDIHIPSPSVSMKFLLFPGDGFDDSGMNINGQENWQWLDELLESLPRSDWGRWAANRKTRKEQLVETLQVLSTPAHYSDIAEQLNEMFEGKDVNEGQVYALLVNNEDVLILLGQGVFSLVAWEHNRSKQSNPILPYCPISLPDPPDYENAFFESVLVGKEQLLNGVTAEQFLHNMLQWTKADASQQKWFLQSILSAYYLIGLIPYTFYLDGNNPVLTCTLPDLGIQELRQYCLQTLTERLAVMPEFWWLLQKEQPARPSTLGDEFADIHPDGLDDVLHRLRMLTGLGAAQKLKYGRYRLTSIGTKCANMWKKQPELNIESTVDLNFENDLMVFAIWE